MPGEFLPQFLRVIASRTPSHLLNEQSPIIPQPQCGRCHQAGTGQAPL